MDLIQNYDVNMQMTLLAKGTADSDTLSLLGIEGNEKSVIISEIDKIKVKILKKHLLLMVFSSHR